jgi:hypothetical protein
MPLALADVTQILDLLVSRSYLTKDSKEMVLELSKTTPGSFVGQLAVMNGLCTEEQLQECLGEQVTLKGRAVIQDCQTIMERGPQEAPKWLKANWGNNGVTPASKNPMILDGAAAAVNMAQNIVMILNVRPDLAAAAQPFVVALAHLAQSILGTDPKKFPLGRSAEWIGQAQAGLRDIVEKSGHVPQDNLGAPIALEDFITARFTDITAGVALATKAADRASAAGLAV